MKKKLSIVIPAYNEEKNIAHLIAELSKSISSTGYDYELIFVNDGSRDNTLQAIQQQADVYPHVFYIELSKNFGKDYALKAGFICILIISLSVCIYTVVSHFRRKRYNGIRTIRQYYLQRGTR